MNDFSYLYTNDARIENLKEKIQWVADCFINNNVPNSNTNKSESNNFSTISYYFGLKENSNLTKAASQGNIDLVILNFIKKFQFPNPRTKDSISNEKQCGEKFAPLREIVKVLVQFYTLGHDSFLTIEEIRLFLFYNSAIAKRRNYNIVELCSQIINYRNTNVLPDSITVPNPSDQFWKHESRQIRELTSILTKVKCIKENNKILRLDRDDLTYQTKGLLFDIVTYDSFWEGNDRQSYLEYFDITDNELQLFSNLDSSKGKISPISRKSKYSVYIAAIRTKPFLLLAGISGSGKSRIVRELARACWPLDSDERKAKKPKNYELIQVKPNWHDSSELIGYVSRIKEDGEEYVYGKFLPFVAQAWKNLDTPYFLCLDEMNLAPVEQYFAEYLSVIETRKLVDGEIKTDPIIESPYSNLTKNNDADLFNLPIESGLNGGWYENLIHKLSFDNQVIYDQFKEDGIAIPPNLIVVGTVNMDETTFTFSRKVLDRAMTIEMNEVDLEGGLEDSPEDELLIEASQLIGDAAEGKDVYAENKEVCDMVIAFLKKINAVLEGTPFKIGYRARNEFLMYAVNRLMLTDDEDKDAVLNIALDEMTSMKILSRIEGDDQRIKEGLLTGLEKILKEQFNPDSNDENSTSSISLNKIKEMKDRLKLTGFTSFWS